MTKLSSTLPGGDNNGLGALARALTTDPHKTALIVAVVDCKSITIDTDTGDKVATVRIRRVEPIDPQDTDQAQRLLVRGLERRTGAVMLPIDLEDELSALFANLVDSVDLETGEITIHTDDPDTAAVVSDVDDEDGRPVDVGDPETVMPDPLPDPLPVAVDSDDLEDMFNQILHPPQAAAETEEEYTAFAPNPPKPKRKSRAKAKPEPVEEPEPEPAPVDDVVDDGPPWPE